MGRKEPFPGWRVVLAPFLCLCAVTLSLQSCSFPDGVPNLTAEEVRRLIDEKGPVLVVDNRTGIEFAGGRLPGAKLITEDAFDRLASLLPADKGLTLIFYCRGYG